MFWKGIEGLCCVCVCAEVVLGRLFNPVRLESVIGSSCHFSAAGMCCKFPSRCYFWQTSHTQDKRYLLPREPLDQVCHSRLTEIMFWIWFWFFFFFLLWRSFKKHFSTSHLYVHIYVYSARACSNTSLKPYSTHWNIHAHDVSWLRCYITYSGLFICMSLRLSMTYGIFWDVFTRRKCRHKLWCMFLRFYCSCAAWDAQVKRPVGCRNLLCGIGEKTRKRSSYLENERRARMSCR